jgi:hypothetical protein
MDNYLFPGVKVEIFQDGKSIDEGTVLTIDKSDENKPTLKLKSEFLRVEGILEFGTLDGENLMEAGWFYIFKDPFNPLKRCFSRSGPIYKFKRK